MWATPSPDSDHGVSLLLGPFSLTPAMSTALAPGGTLMPAGHSLPWLPPSGFRSPSEASQLFKKNFMKYSQKTGRKPKQKIPDILCGPVDKVQVL